MAVPKLVVFDLDACCWYPEMYMLRRGTGEREDRRDCAKGPGGIGVVLVPHLHLQGPTCDESNAV